MTTTQAQLSMAQMIMQVIAMKISKREVAVRKQAQSDPEVLSNPQVELLVAGMKKKARSTKKEAVKKKTEVKKQT